MAILLILGTVLLGFQDPSSLERHVAALDAETVEERERAQKALLDLGEPALPRLWALEVRAAGETRARLREIVREIVFRRDEAFLDQSGFPRELARRVPRFRDRFFSKDEAVVLECLKETFGGREALAAGAPNWVQNSTGFQGDQIGSLLRSVFGRAQGEPLKVAALNLAEAHRAERLGTLVGRCLDDPEPGVRRAALEAACCLGAKGREETLGRWLRRGSEQERSLALGALEVYRSPQGLGLIQTALDDASPSVRGQAIRCLSQALEVEAIPAIRKLLKDPEPQVRSAAIAALVQLGAVDAIGDVLALEEDPSDQVRMDVLSFIGHFRNRQGAQALLRAIEKPDEMEIWQVALTTAGQLRLTEALPALVKQMRKPDPDRGEWISSTIAQIGPGPHEGEICRMTRDSNPVIRALAFQALLSDHPSGETVAEILKALGDPELEVRTAAAVALARTQCPQAIPALRTALKEEALREVILNALGEAGPPDAGTLATPYLDDPNPRVVGMAIGVVRKHHVPEAIPRLEKLLESPLDILGVGTVVALSSVAGPRSFPALHRALDLATEATRQRIWICLAGDPDEAGVDAAIERFPRLPAYERKQALEVILSYPCAKSTAFLSQLIRDPDAPRREEALLALAARKDPSVIQSAREGVRTRRGDAQLQAARLLLAAGEADDAAASALVQAAQEGGDNDLAGLRWVLVRPEAKSFLLEALLRSESYHRGAAALAMGRFPPSSFDLELRALASAPEPAGRRGAAAALRYVQTPDRRQLLRKLLGDAAPSVRLEAVMAFWSETPPEFPAELESRFTDSSSEVRAAAAEVMGRLSPAGVEKHALALLSDPVAQVRDRALVAVGTARVRPALPLVEKLLEDPDDAVRAQAARTIGRIGLEKNGEKLFRLYERDPDAWVRFPAAASLLALGDPRGPEAVRSFLLRGAYGLEGPAAIALIEQQDRASLPAALKYLGRSSRTSWEANRTLLALNTFTQPELYRKMETLTVDLRGWKGTEREWLEKLAQTLGLPLALDPGLPEFALSGHRHDPQEENLLEQLSSLGTYLGAAAVLEPGRLRVMRRSDAIERWERWAKEAK